MPVPIHVLFERFLCFILLRFRGNFFLFTGLTYGAARRLNTSNELDSVPRLD